MDTGMDMGMDTGMVMVMVTVTDMGMDMVEALVIMKKTKILTLQRKGILLDYLARRK